MIENLVLTAQDIPHSIWAQDVWHEPIWIAFDSISDATKKLRAFPVQWCLLPTTSHRRAELIAAKIDTVKRERIEFGKSEIARKPFGCFALLSENTIVASLKTSTSVPLGVYEFVENKTIPPNRAYLKLWEALTRLQVFPKAGETCLDLGASPGGWTWVLASLGASVISVDKAPLDPKIAKLKNVKARLESAFALEPKDFDHVDWLFSDVICYPERLLECVQKWIDSGRAKRMICTVKLQGDTDFQVLDKFQSLPNSKLIHLYHNKHEVTWFYASSSLREDSIRTSLPHPEGKVPKAEGGG